MKRQSILVPLDGSDLARAALPFATTLARAHGTGIELIGVVNHLGSGVYAGRLEALRAEALGGYLVDAAEQLRAQGFGVDVCVRRGSPAETILMHADKRRARAVVLTTHGFGERGQTPVGSVAKSVVCRAECPVLTINPNGGLAPLTWRPRRLLVPLDGSAEAESALMPAFRLAAALQAAVVLARVQPRIAWPPPIYGTFIPGLSALDQHIGAVAARYLRAISSGAPADIPVHTRVVRGDVAEGLIDLAAAEGIDLVVLAPPNRGQTGPERLDNVTDQIIRHGPPALIVHPAMTEAQPAPPTPAAIAV